MTNHFNIGNIWTHTKPEDVKGNRWEIGFDMDSVLNEMGDDLGRHLAKEFGVSLDDLRAPDETGVRRFHFSHPSISHTAIADEVMRYVREESINLEATPYMRLVTRYVYEITKVPILVVTCRPASAVSSTYNWLKNNLDVPFMCCMVDGHRDKAAILEAVRCKMFVDDRYRTCMEIADAGMLPVVYDRPWNIGRDTYKGAVHAADLRDILPVVNILHGKPPLYLPDYIPYPLRVYLKG